MAKEGKVEEAMLFLRQNNPELYLKQGKKIENPLIDVYNDKTVKNQSGYPIDNFYLSLDNNIIHFKY